MEELEFIIEACEESMTNAVKHLERELLNIRAGKANPTDVLGSKDINETAPKESKVKEKAPQEDSKDSAES